MVTATEGARTRRKVAEIESDLIRLDGGTQCRESMDEATICTYAVEMGEGAEFPPLVVFFDGAAYWLADGFHRYHAYLRALVTSIPCEVHKGTQRDAILYAVGANAKQGLRRTNADKRLAVFKLLDDDEWRKLSDAKVADICGTGVSLVRTVRSQVVSKTTSNDQPATRTGKDGKQYKASRPGKSQPSEPDEPEAEPEAKSSARTRPAAEPADITQTWIDALRGIQERLTGIKEQYGTVAEMVRSPLWQRGFHRQLAKDITRELAKSLTQFAKEWPDE